MYLVFRSFPAFFPFIQRRHQYGSMFLPPLCRKYVVLSDLDVVLSDLYVDFSDLSVNLSLIHLLENQS